MSANPRSNRGGMGWQEPAHSHFQDAFFYHMGARKQGKTHAQQEAVIRAIMEGKATPELLRAAAEAGLIFPMGFDAGDASPAPPVRNPLTIHDDPIDMVEINGVWMCATDAHTALVQIGRR